MYNNDYELVFNLQSLQKFGTSTSVKDICNKL
jgi:hypothetical protein